MNICVSNIEWMRRILDTSVFLFRHTTQPKRCWDAHNRARNRLEHTTEQAVHTTEPTCFANKRCLRIAYIGNLNISKSCKYTSHIQNMFFKQYAPPTKLSMSGYCPLTLIGCLLFSFEMRHTTEPRCSVVCVYTAWLCAGRLGGVEGHPWYNSFGLNIAYPQTKSTGARSSRFNVSKMMPGPRSLHWR